MCMENKREDTENLVKLIIPNRKSEFITAWPGKGPNTYQKVGQEILHNINNLRLQSGEETSSLLTESYTHKGVEFEDVKHKFDRRWFWIYQVNFWLPEKDKNSGMYSVYDSKALGREMEFNQEELEEKLRESEVYHGIRINRENGIAFAPRSTISLGGQKDWDKFAINGMNIAIFSPEGAENLAELGKTNFKCDYKFGVFGKDNVEKRVSSLEVDYNGDRLVVYGNNWADDRNGVAFGVFKN